MKINKRKTWLLRLGPTEHGTCKDAKAQMKDEKWTPRRFPNISEIRRCKSVIHFAIKEVCDVYAAEAEASLSDEERMQLEMEDFTERYCDGDGGECEDNIDVSTSSEQNNKFNIQEFVLTLKNLRFIIGQ